MAPNCKVNKVKYLEHCVLTKKSDKYIVSETHFFVTMQEHYDVYRFIYVRFLA